MFKNALISVSNKNGLIEFVKPLASQGMRIVSTGGTLKYLLENGISAVDVAEQTGFPEVMGGRVKTLHPNVHMALLARIGVDEALLKEKKLEPFDLLVCNLYPFEEAVKSELKEAELIEKIDIGGPSMLRAAAKNFSRMTVVCDPLDYPKILMQAENTLESRKSLAAKVFAHTASYDSLVAKEMGAGWSEEFSFSGRKIQDLRYGENPQQKASWYGLLANTKGLHSAEILQGKELSYNNILDIDAACRLVQDLRAPKISAAVAVKHNNPCGAAIHENSFLALKKALTADPVSVFGGIIAVSFPIDRQEAEELKNIFLECIVAPHFTKAALEVLAGKKNLRLLQWKNICDRTNNTEVRSVQGGYVVQTSDKVKLDTKDWKYQGEAPSDAILQDLHFSENVCASLKSNAIALVKDGQTLGLGMGQVNRVDSVKHAIERMLTHFGEVKNVILASDAFFPFPDSIEIAASAGVKWILQPGGSVKDSDVLAAARKLKIEMVLTGERHFRH
jgi:phosphoribosylaminoimidazolecarboxamide formyltransferase / IMP cyclohydrolase